MVKRVTELVGVRAWAKLHEQTTAGKRWDECSECDVNTCTRNPQWEEKWKVMMSELGGDAKIPDLWRMSALLEICPRDVKEQMLMRLDEIGENCLNLKAKVIIYTTNKAEQTRGQKETAAPMELDYVSGSEVYDEEWDKVDEVRRDRQSYNCGMMGHFAKDCRTRSKGKGKGKDGGNGYGKGKGKFVNKQERKIWASPDVSREDVQESRMTGDAMGSAGGVARQDTSRQSVDVESTM